MANHIRARLEGVCDQTPAEEDELLPRVATALLLEGVGVTERLVGEGVGSGN